MPKGKPQPNRKKKRKNREVPTEHPSYKAIVGLGNPGGEYDCTRHNLGFMVVDTIAGSRNVKFHRECKSYLGSYTDNEAEVILAKPITYMNNSGRAVRAMMADYDLDPGNMMFVCDDMNLPLGKMRFRRKGACGGHKGLESIAEALGGLEFSRLRIGIDEPGRMDAEKYVLARFRKAEMPVIEEVRGQAAEALDLWLRKGIDEAMSQFN